MFVAKRIGRGRRAEPSLRSLLFIHIPKSAGTTFQTILAKVYSPADYCAIYPDWETIKPVVVGHSWGTALRAVGGHFPYGLHEDAELRPLLNERIDYVTLLRDPVARVVSHFNHVMNGEYPEHREVFERHPTIEKFIEHEWARDVQTSFLLDRKIEPDDDPEEAIRDAEAILRDRIKVVGLAERFDETLILCAEAFGWELPTYASANRAIDRGKRIRVKDLDKSVIDRIKAANPRDMAVYERGKALFEERCAQIPRFAAKLNRYRARFERETPVT